MIHHPAASISPITFPILGLAGALCAGTAWAQFGTVALDTSLADAAAKVEVAVSKNAQGAALGYCEGPSVDAAGNVFFTEQTSDNANRILKLDAQGQLTVFASGFQSNGTEFDAQGRLVVAQKDAVVRYDAAGTRTPLTGAADGLAGVATNDLTIGSSGAMFFSSWAESVYYRSSAGAVTKIPGFSTANGLEWIEEKKKLYVSQDGIEQVWAYDVADDGRLSNGVLFASLTEPDGITADEKGNLYVAGWNDGKIMAFDAAGQSLGSITVKSATASDNNQNGNTSNLVFGGPDGKTLFITGDGGLYKVKLKVAGRKRPGATGIGLPRSRTFNATLGAYPSASEPAAAHDLAGRALADRIPGGRKPAAVRITTAPLSR
ncbi:MAG: SMP-30/gluconolactonase/LRE family protein [Fibrobacteria bacterium]